MSNASSKTESEDVVNRRVVAPHDDAAWLLLVREGAREGLEERRSGETWRECVVGVAQRCASCVVVAVREQCKELSRV